MRRILEDILRTPPACPEDVEALVARVRSVLSPDPCAMTAGQKAAATRRARLLAGTAPAPILSPRKSVGRAPGAILAPRPPALAPPAPVVLKPGQLPPIGTPVIHAAKPMDARSIRTFRGVVTAQEPKANGWRPGVVVWYADLVHKGKRGLACFHEWPAPWLSLGAF